MKGWLIYLNFAIPWFALFLPRGAGIFAVTVLVPLAMIVFNCVIFFTGVETSPLKCCAFMASSFYLGMVGSYLIWGIQTKNLFQPDAETVWVYQKLTIYYFFIVIVLFAILIAGRAGITFLKR